MVKEGLWPYPHLAAEQRFRQSTARTREERTVLRCLEDKWNQAPACPFHVLCIGSIFAQETFLDENSLYLEGRGNRQKEDVLGAGIVDYISYVSNDVCRIKRVSDNTIQATCLDAAVCRHNSEASVKRDYC